MDYERSSTGFNQFKIMKHTNNNVKRFDYQSVQEYAIRKTKRKFKIMKHTLEKIWIVIAWIMLLPLIFLFKLLGKVFKK